MADNYVHEDDRPSRPDNTVYLTSSTLIIILIGILDVCVGWWYPVFGTGVCVLAIEDAGNRCATEEDLRNQAKRMRLLLLYRMADLVSSLAYMVLWPLFFPLHQIAALVMSLLLALMAFGFQSRIGPLARLLFIVSFIIRILDTHLLARWWAFPLGYLVLCVIDSGMRIFMIIKRYDPSRAVVPEGGGGVQTTIMCDFEPRGEEPSDWAPSQCEMGSASPIVNELYAMWSGFVALRNRGKGGHEGRVKPEDVESEVVD